MSAGGNAFVLPYAEVLVEAPLIARGTAIVHQTEPIYPLVVSGLVVYAGQPINLSAHRGEFYMLLLL